MQSENPMIADFVKLMNSAAATLAGMGREAGDSAREKAREIFGGMDFVSREEFDTVKDIATAAAAEVDTLKARLDAIEAGLKGTSEPL